MAKAGTETHGLDRFFSSLAGKPVPGLAFFTLALISPKQRISFPMQVVQMFRARNEPDDAANATPTPDANHPTSRSDGPTRPSADPPKRKPGRPRKDAAPQPTPDPPKRKPGRPRKDAAPQPTPDPPKRKPGRPRKMALFLCHLSYCLLRPCRERDPEFSLLDLKAHERGLKYVEETIQMLPEIPEPSLLKRTITRRTGIGRIHPAETEAIAV